MKKELIVFEEWISRGVRAAVTTRYFPLTLKKTDDLLDLANQKKFKDILEKSPTARGQGMDRYERFVLLNQVHGSGVAVLEEGREILPKGFRHVLEVDAVITNIRRLALLVFTADCLSIYFHAGKWVGLAHAGWRGTKDDIAVKTLKILSEKSGIPTGQIQVIFGPSICAEHYEVGEEFKNYFDPGTLQLHNGRLCLDVRAENRRRLLQAGVAMEAIQDSGLCTVCHGESFYSFRYEQEGAGRMVSLAAID